MRAFLVGLLFSTFLVRAHSQQIVRAETTSNGEIASVQLHTDVLAPAGELVHAPEPVVKTVPAIERRPPTLVPMVSLDEPPKRTADKKFWIVGALYTATVMFDLQTTHYCIAHIRGCREGNGILPQSSIGQHAILLPIAVWSWHSAWKQKKSDSKLWWFAEAAQTAAHAAAGIHNLRVIQTH